MQPLREGVDNRDTDAVQSAGHLVAVAAELPAGVQLRQNDRQRRLSLLWHNVHRDPRPLVFDRHRVVRMENYLETVVATSERLVDSVVDDFVDEMMEPPRARRADVHARAQPDRLEALEDGDVFGGIGVFAH